MQMHTLAFPPFEPDKASYNRDATDATLNALPAADGWKPMPSLVEVSDALPAACVGAIFHKGSDGTVTLFAATSTNLYQYNAGSWDEVSKSTDAYSVPTDQRAAFLVFGDYVFVNNLGTTPQKFLVGTDSAFSDNTSMPQARYMWTAGDFVVCGYLSGEESSIQWSGINDGTFWTVGERGADKQEIPGGGEIMGGIGDQRGAVVILRERMVYMQFAPDSGYTFTIAGANDARGAVAPLSISQIGPGDFVYYSEDGFFRGVQGQPLGAERVDAWFQERADLDAIEEMRGIVDPFEKIVWFRFVKTDASAELLGYDWQLDRWCRSDQDLQEAAVLATSAETWSSIGSLYASWAAASAVSWDSRLLKGGRPTFAAFSTDNKLAYFSGTPQAATLETATVELNANRRTFVNGGRLIGNVDTFTARIGATDDHSTAVSFDGAVSPSSRSKHLPFRSSGRLHRARINIAATQDWDTVSAIYLEGNPEGNA